MAEFDSPAQALRRERLRPKRSWGQNFLGDAAALSKISQALRAGPDDVVVELGPGLGHLTRALLATGACVVAIERDRDMVQILERQELPKLTVIPASATAVDFAKVAGRERVLLCGNLPYHLTSSILFAVLAQHRSLERAVFTIQREVAFRLAAQPGTRDCGLLSVLLGLHFDIEALFGIEAALFYPPPKVDSAVVRLTRLPSPRAEVTSDEHFTRIVKAAFARRRKTLLNSLKSDVSLGSAAQLKVALEAAGIDAQRRAETLSVGEFAALERAFALG